MPPNILWLMTDEQRTDSMGCYGSPWAQTPCLDRLAGQGALFKNAVTQAPVCGPARAAILTGEYPSKSDVWYNSPATTFQSHLTDVFRSAGYQTASFGKQHYVATNQAFDDEGHFVLSDQVSYFKYNDQFNPDDFGAVTYPPEPYGWIFGGRFPGGADQTSEAKSVAAAKSWLEDRSGEEPFLLRVSFNGPHTPAVPPEPFDTIINGDHIVFPPEVESITQGESDWIASSLRPMADLNRLTQTQISAMRRYYYGEVAYLDSLIEELTDWMGVCGFLDNTIVMFVSDHGAHLGDHLLVQKQTFYEPSVTVPCFITHTQTVNGGQVVETPVETRWLLPTLLELSGLSAPDHLSNCSMSIPLAGGVEPPSVPVFSEFTLGSFGIRHDDRLVMVRDGNWKLSMCLDPTPHDSALYNLGTDPFELTNLAGLAESHHIESRLSGLIENHISESST